MHGVSYIVIFDGFLTHRYYVCCGGSISKKKNKNKNKNKNILFVQADCEPSVSDVDFVKRSQSQVIFLYYEAVEYSDHHRPSSMQIRRRTLV